MSLALEGIKVVEVTTHAAAPMGGRLLADWGADVIHVEHPVTGDPWRTWMTQGGIEFPPEISYQWWENYNRNKKSITLDLSQEAGREIIYKLVEGADVFMSNRRPFELERYSLKYDDLSKINPRLIYASLTGLGRKGPEKDLPGHDGVMFWARSGILFMLHDTGLIPPAPGYRMVACGDKLTSVALAGGIILALLVRERMGIGQEVDVSLLHTGIFALAPVALALGPVEQAFGSYQEFEETIKRNREDISPLVLSYETKDGRWLQLSLVPPEPYWSRFCKVIEREDIEHDPRFESTEVRAENKANLFPIVAEAFRTKTLAEWKTRLTEARMLFAPIQNLQEVTADPQARANDVFVPFDHPAFGKMEVVANPIKLSKTPATIRTLAPEFSQHTEEVLLELGYTWENIEQFKQQGVIA